MARKKRHEEHENHERWLISYADFITLLFAFFVVMYALSSVNEGKYRVLSDSLVNAFDNPNKDIEPITISDSIKAPPDLMINILSPINPNSPARSPILLKDNAQPEAPGSSDQASKLMDKNNLDKVYDRLSFALSKMIEQDLIKVNKNGDGIDVEINSSILFNSGSAMLQPQAIPVLTEIARIIKVFPNAIRVEGYTDDIPIETTVYPSNWELSAGRAASVVHLFSDERVDPFRLSATGYGQYRPIAANTTPAGRNANRRVVVMILSQAAAKSIEREALSVLKKQERPVSDVNLDATLPLIRHNAPTTNSLSGGLPAVNQGSSTSNGTKERTGSLLEDISPQTATESQTNRSSALQIRGGQ